MKKLALFLLAIVVLTFSSDNVVVPPTTPSPIDFKYQSGKEIWVFTAKWCGPCREYEETLKIIESKGYKVRRIDVDEHSELVEEYNIQVYPTTLVMEDGEEEEREEGKVDPFALFKLLGDTLKAFIPKLLNIIFML